MKTMLVTGASSGIGWALAVRAARAGYAVYGVGRERAALDRLQAKIEGERGLVATGVVDVGDPAGAAPLIARVLARFGSLDVLVNNAGFASAGALSAQPDAELERQFATHVIGPVALVREARAPLAAARGHVFMLGSGVARIPIGGLGAYPPAKAALRSATAILRRELAAQGIAVTYVDPGAVATPFMPRAGMRSAPSAALASPEAVARKILIAVGDRSPVLNAVAWQTALVALAERFPRLTERLLERAPTFDASRRPAAALAPAAPADVPAEAPPSEPASAEREETTFEVALEPLARRMEKLNLRAPFVRELLIPEAVLEVGDVALRWAGMPNKNERGLTADVLEALADAGFLERNGEQTYRVIRGA